MNVIQTKLAGVVILEPTVYTDHRGFFKETYRTTQFKEIGIDMPFVQDNHSRSYKGVLRGLHFQKTAPQGKLVCCSAGAVYDVAVDVDPNSASFGEYIGVELSSTNHKQLWIPPGYAHGFCVLSTVADFQYKCTDYFSSEDDAGLIWNDPDVAILWPVNCPILSTKDTLLPTLAQIKEGGS
jgi:dTDP-4-dehydrorhamnose 3,5-epimerase